MKIPSYLYRSVLFASVGAIVAGCSPSADETDANSVNTVDRQMEAVERDASDTGDDLAKFTYAQKQEFVDRMEKQLEAMENSIDEISDSIGRSTVAVRAEAAPKLVALRAKKESLEEQLEVIKDSGASTWESAKMTTSNSFNDLKGSFNDMRQWLSDTVEP